MADSAHQKGKAGQKKRDQLKREGEHSRETVPRDIRGRSESRRTKKAKGVSDIQTRGGAPASYRQKRRKTDPEQSSEKKGSRNQKDLAKLKLRLSMKGGQDIPRQGKDTIRRGSPQKGGCGATVCPSQTPARTQSQSKRYKKGLHL